MRYAGDAVGLASFAAVVAGAGGLGGWPWAALVAGVLGLLGWIVAEWKGRA